MLSALWSAHQKLYVFYPYEVYITTSDFWRENWGSENISKFSMVTPPGSIREISNTGPS